MIEPYFVYHLTLDHTLSSDHRDLSFPQRSVLIFFCRAVEIRKVKPEEICMFSKVTWILTGLPTLKCQPPRILPDTYVFSKYLSELVKCVVLKQEMM